MQDGTIEVMVNRCYGGFGLSEKAVAEYCKIMGLDNEDGIVDLQRHDPQLLKIVKAMGTKQASGRYANIELQRIPAQYVNHYSICEYDGMETLVINYNAYKVDSAKEILRNKELSKSEKLARVTALLNADLESDLRNGQ